MQVMTSIPSNIDLGCGNQKPNGFYGVDIIDCDEVDLVQDLNNSNWDLPSDYFDIIRAIDVFEHLEMPNNFMSEVWRIASQEARITIRGPHFSSGNWHDPTHKRLLGSRSFEHYTVDSRYGFYIGDKQFELIDYQIQFQWQSILVYKRIGRWIANQFTSIYEKTLLRNLFPATNIEFHIKPIK